MADTKALSNGQKVSPNVSMFKSLVNGDEMKRRAEELMGKESPSFLASCLSLYTSTNLVNCDPKAVLAQCMKAAALKLPIDANLGFAYVIPYANVPTFQIGYKGLLQLAQRTGQYKHINADCVFEGEVVVNNRISGMVEISGEPKSDKVIGYFAYFKLLNGFEKCIYWSKERVEMHAAKFSAAYKAKKKDSPWFTNFDAMALKTMIKQIIPKYGVMSIDFVNAIAMDNEAEVENEVAQNANATPIVIPDNMTDEPKPVTKGNDAPAPALSESALVEPDFSDVPF